MNGSKKTKVIKKAKTLIIALLILYPYQGCDLIEILSINCSQCYTNSPEWYTFKVQVTFNEENQFVPITTYRGPFEDNNVAFYDTLYRINQNREILVETGKYYTLVAEYRKDGRNYLVVNGGRLKVRKDYESCDQPCYHVIRRDIDLQIY